jgi:ketosteroid isomerase-like protein
MQADEAVVDELYNRYGNGDSTYLWGILADDVTWRSCAFGHWQGIDGVRACLSAMASQWDLTRHEYLGKTGNADGTFTVRVAIAATYRATGRSVSLEKKDTIRMSGGKIAAYEEAFDTAILSRAMVDSA